MTEALDDLAGRLVAFMSKGGSLQSVFNKVPGFPVREPEFLDLGAVLTRLTKTGKLDAKTRAAAAESRRLLDEAVIANRSHLLLRGTGLSVYPGGGNDDADYNANIILFAKDTQWDEFIRAAALSGGGRAVDTAGQPNRYAVLIGVGDYQDKDVPDLQYSIPDVEAVRNALIKNGYAPENVIMVTEADATVAKVRTTLGTRLPAMAGENDMVLVYFSGHGAAESSVRSNSKDGTEKYMLLSDSRTDDLYGTALPMSELARIFKRVTSNKLLFVMDACYSGAARTRGSLSMDDEYLGRLAASEGRIALTASRADEVSMESPQLGHGVFTYHFVKMLNGAGDLNGDKIVSLVEGYQYLVDNVTDEAKKMGASQHPMMNGDLQGEFPLARIVE